MEILASAFLCKLDLLMKMMWFDRKLLLNGTLWWAFRVLKSSYVTFTVFVKWYRIHLYLLCRYICWLLHCWVSCFQSLSTSPLSSVVIRWERWDSWAYWSSNSNHSSSVSCFNVCRGETCLQVSYSNNLKLWSLSLWANVCLTIAEKHTRYTAWIMVEYECKVVKWCIIIACSCFSWFCRVVMVTRSGTNASKCCLFFWSWRWNTKQDFLYLERFPHCFKTVFSETGYMGTEPAAKSATSSSSYCYPNFTTMKITHNCLNGVCETVIIQ